jgi:hypothetical protein
MEFLLHSRSRHGDANAVEIRDPEKKNEENYDGMQSISGALHRGSAWVMIPSVIDYG